MPTLVEAGALYRAKAAELKTFADSHRAKGPDGNYTTESTTGRPLYDFTPDELTEFNKRNDELQSLTEQFEALRKVQEVIPAVQERLAKLGKPALSLPQVAAGQVGHDAPKGCGKSLGEMITEHAEYKTRQPLIGRAKGAAEFAFELPDIEYKTLMERTAGWDPETTRQDRVVLYALRPVRVPDLIPTTTTNLDTIRFMEETTHTNNAAATAEGANLSESALAFTERSEAIQKIGTWLPVTDEQLADVGQLRDLIDNRLTVMLNMKVETDYLNATGVSPQITGLLNKSGIQTQAKGTDPAPDAIFKAFTKVRWTGYAEPSAVILHPNDWQDIRLLRDTDGRYLFGSPGDAVAERIWGKPVVVTNAIAENTGLTADFPLYTQAFERQGIVIESTNSHGEYFIAGKQAIRIVTRRCLAIYRAAALCTVTSL